MESIFVIIFFAIIGGVLASFGCAAGMCTDGYWHRKRSVCDSCRKPLKVWELIPVISFLILKGRCSSCGAQIPRICLYTEMYGMLLGAVAGYFCSGNMFSAVIAMCILAAVIVHTVTDIRERLLYDWPSLLILTSAALYRIVMFIESGYEFEYLISGIAGLIFAVVIYGGLYLLKGMGSGDVVLSAAFGMLLGPLGIYFMTTGAAILTLFYVGFIKVWKRIKIKDLRNLKIAFGPALSLAGYIIYLLQSQSLV